MDEEAGSDVESKFENESSSETWIKHDGDLEGPQIDSTVRKNDAKKKRLPLAESEILAKSANKESSAPNNETSGKPSPAKLLTASETDTTSEKSLSRRGSQSDSASTVSQTSYDPSKPSFKGMSGEIPENSSSGTLDSNSSVSLVTKTKGQGSFPGFKPPKIPFRSPRGGGGGDGGVVLVSRRPIGSQAPSGGGQGITLLSSRPLDTGYAPQVSSRASLHEEEVSSSMMLPDYADEGKSQMVYTVNRTQQASNVADDSVAGLNKRENQFQSCSITDWTVEHVCHWLMALELDQYSSEFRDKNVTGMQLLQLDGSKLKSLGVGDGNDRALLKKKIKEMKTAAEKERKQQEKEKKAKEKDQGKRKLFKKR